jgi:hypothetical protein
LHTHEDSGIRLDAEGQWWHDGERVTHPKIIDAWNRGIERDDSGRCIIRFGADWAVIQVDDVPIQVLGARLHGGGVVLALSDGRSEPLDASTLHLSRAGVLYCKVRSGTLPARFSRNAHFIVGEQLEEREGEFVLELGGETFTVRSDE